MCIRDRIIGYGFYCEEKIKKDKHGKYPDHNFRLRLTEDDYEAVINLRFIAKFFKQSQIMRCSKCDMVISYGM